MNVRLSVILVAFAVAGSVANAQQAPARPASPTPPAPPATPAPAAASAPRVERPPAPPTSPRANGLDRDFMSSEFSRSLTEQTRAQAEEARVEARAAAAAIRADAAVVRAEANGMRALNADRLRDGQYEFERAQQRMSESIRDAQFGVERTVRAAQERIGDMNIRLDNLAPIASINSTISTSISAALGSFAAAPRFMVEPALGASPASALLPRWQEDWSQDRDPADSLYSAARDLMNRGEWRRAADQFSQVYSKFPKSTRVPASAYYEAFARYRIGSTEELRAGLRVLTERARGANGGTSNGSTISVSGASGVAYSSGFSGQASSYGGSAINVNEVNVLTTRIRGALAARGDQDAMRQLAADAQKGNNCDTEDMQIRAEALSALASSDMGAATPMLRRVLEKKDPCTLELRRRALSILLRRADTAATSAAILVARNADETTDLRTDAISYLSRLPGDNALAALEELMRNSTDRDIQRAAVRSLSNSENTRARQAIRALIERSDVSEQLRVEAIGTFERDRGTNADDAAYLRGLYPKLQADRLKRAAIAAISKNPGTDNEQFVLTVARNPNESSETRSDAISRMYRIPAISIADIGKLYDNADSRGMRDQIITVLSQRKEPETVDKLGDIAKNGTDPRLRTQAINALNRKDDPRAKKLVIDIASGTP